VGTNTLVARREGVALTMTWSAPLVARLVSAAEDPPLGWYSSTLDQKQPAIAAVMEMSSSTGVEVDFELQIAFNTSRT
jgi:hypothetical protein